MNQSMNQRDMFFKWLYYAGAVLLLVLVQSLVLNRISVWAVHPFLPPVIAGIMAMLEGPAEGAVFGGIFGLLCDLTMPGVIPCFYTLAFLAAALSSTPCRKVSSTVCSRSVITRARAAHRTAHRNPWLRSRLAIIAAGSAAASSPASSRDRRT